MPARDSSRASGAHRLGRFATALRIEWVARYERRFPRASAILFAFVPALLAGYQLGVLTLFLNAHLPRSVAELAGGALRGALLLVPFWLLVHALVARRRNVRTSRILPWSVTAVLVAAALGDWVHASRYSFYLAPALGANLIKLALWLSLAAIVCFYTALLHTVHHRRYGPRSVALLVVMALGSVYVGRARLVSHRPSAAPPPAAVARAALTPRFAVAIVDGATLDVLLPLARQSRLPFFSALFESGASARLASVTPVAPLAARASLATGKLPYRHGLLGSELARSFWLPAGELRLVPVGFEDLGLTGRRDAAIGERKARALWEIVAAAGARVAAIGTPAPLLDERGLDFAASAALFEGDPRARATPSSFDGRIRLLAGAAAAEDPAAAAPFTAVVEEALAGDRWRAAVAESLLTGVDEVDVLVVELPGFNAVALETRGGFEAAELEGSRGRSERDAAAALTAYAAALDSMLERIWERLDPPRRLVVVSPFGVDRSRGALRVVREVGRRRRLAGTLSGQPDGVLWILAEGLARPGASLPGARVVDVAPTLLYLAGLPLARDFDGRVLTEALEPELLKSQPLAFLSTYGTVPARDP